MDERGVKLILKLHRLAHSTFAQEAAHKLFCKSSQEVPTESCAENEVSDVFGKTFFFLMLEALEVYENACEALPLLQAGVVEYGQPIDLDADIKATCAFELAKIFV